MNVSFFAGIDISKNSLDVAVRDERSLLFHISIENNKEGLKQFVEQCQSSGVSLERCWFCWGSPAASILVSTVRYCSLSLIGIT